MPSSYTLVRCPACEDLHKARGEESFRHCGALHPISQYRVRDPEPETPRTDESARETDNTGPDRADPEDLFDHGGTMSSEDETQDVPTEGSGDTGSYSCGNCDANVEQGQAHCHSCGEKLVWNAV